MQTIAVKDIIISPNRQRQEFEPQALGELSEAIRDKGLMHAIVLREIDGGRKQLVAGERRLKAITDMWMLGGELKYNGQIIPEDFVPFVTLGQLTPLQAEEAELEENIHRKDLTWQENASAMSRLHSIRSRQAQAEGRIHTVADTAMEVKGRSDGSYQDSVRKDLIVARHLDNPDVMKAKTADEAFKILKRQEIAQKNITLAESVGKTFSSALHHAHNVNCLTWMEQCPPNTFNVILTDPPYGMGADGFGNGGGGRLANNEHHYKDDYEHWIGLMRAWAPLSFKVAKAEAHAYIFCDIDNFHELKSLMQQAGWYVFRTPMIHTKPNSGRVPLPDEGPRRQYETILYAIKGHKKTTAIYPDVITTFADAGLQHGAQKPVSLYENLLQRSVRPGDTILDAFAGSGTIFPAAHTFKCAAVGLEMATEYYGICLQRINDLDASRKAPAADGKAMGDELKQMLKGAM
jgi:DNA modification methylase